MAQLVEGLRKVLFLKDTVGKKWLIVPHLDNVDASEAGEDIKVVSGSTYGKEIALPGVKKPSFSFSQKTTSEAGKKFSTEILLDAKDARTKLEGIVAYISDMALQSAVGTQIEGTTANLLPLTDHKPILVEFYITGAQESPADYGGQEVLVTSYTCSVAAMSRISSIPTIA